jgi:hypothetical protein
MIYKMDPAGNILASYPSPGLDPSGLAFDGTSLWSADASDAKIYKLNLSGDTLATFDAPGSQPRGLAFDGNHLWNVNRDFGQDTIYQLEIPLAVPVGTSRAWSLTLSNEGGDDLHVRTLAIDGADAPEFSIQNDNCSAQTLSPFETATFDVVFTPTSAGEKSVSIIVPSNDPDSPLTVPFNWSAVTSSVPEQKPSGMNAVYMLLLGEE